MARKTVLEKAVFSNPKPRDLRSRWALFVFLMLLLGVVYWICRDVVYDTLIHRYAQEQFNHLFSARIEKMGYVSIDRQGDLTIHDGEVWTSDQAGQRRLFFKARRVRLTFDGVPLRDAPLRIMRVDLFQPEIFIRREADSVWNVEWAFGTSERYAPEAPTGPDEWKDYPRPEGFPRNGVHIFDGILNTTFARRNGQEITWQAHAVRGRLMKVDGVFKVEGFKGDFYGGTLTGSCEVAKTTPFTVSHLLVDVRDADVARMAEGVTFITRPVSGRLNGVLSLTYDRERTRSKKPIAAGHLEITDGNLWEFPAFAGILNLLCLTPVSDRRIDSAVLTFTMEKHRVRVDEAQFLGYPVSLFGDGECSLTGDWMEIVFVPRLGKSDWNSILPIIGAPIDLLGNIIKGLLMPVVLSGSFDNPKFEVDTGYPLQASTRRLIEENSPR